MNVLVPSAGTQIHRAAETVARALLLLADDFEDPQLAIGFNDHLLVVDRTMSADDITRLLIAESFSP